MQDTEAKITSWILSTQDQALDLLEQLVSINSFTTNVAGVNQTQDLIANFLAKLRLSVRRVPVAGRADILIARTAAPCGRSILLVGHADTVHPPDSPFRGFTRDETRAFGPGVLDMKGGLVTILWSLKALSEHGLLDKLPISVLINSDEEVGCPETHRIVEEEAKAARCALVFEWGRAKDGIILRRKGVGSFLVKVRGKAAHAGNAHREGANAVVQLAHSITRLSSLTDYGSGVTVNVGVIQGGSAINTVPEFAQASLDVRVERTEDFLRLKDKILSIASEVVVNGTQVEVEARSFLPPMVETEESDALFESFRQFGPPAGLHYDKVPGILGGGSDANRTAYQGVPSIDGLGPFGDFAHSDKEYIQLDSLPKKMINLALWLAKQS